MTAKTLTLQGGILTIVQNDPGETSDPWGIVAVQYNTKTRKAFIKFAKRLIDEGPHLTHKVALYMRRFARMRDCVMGIELNNLGRKYRDELSSQYGINLHGITTCGKDVESTLKKMNKYKAIKYTVRMFEEGRLQSPTRHSQEMQELISQIFWLQTFMGADGSVKIRAKKGHDDLAMALILCVHIIMMYEQEAGYNDDDTGVL